MNDHVDRMVVEAKQLSYEELEAASKRILGMLDQMEWNTTDSQNLEQKKSSRAKKPRKSSKKKDPAERQPKKDVHPFDNLTKALFGEDGASIVPELVEGAQLIKAENVEQDKQTIEEALKAMFTYEEVIQDDPVIQNLLAQRELVGKAEGRHEGLEDSILNFLSIRFSPAFASKARPAIKTIRSYDALKMLFRLLVKAPDEQSAQVELDLLDEQSDLESPDSSDE
jgi:hypothetical protein